MVQARRQQLAASPTRRSVTILYSRISASATPYTLQYVHWQSLTTAGARADVRVGAHITVGAGAGPGTAAAGCINVNGTSLHQQQYKGQRGQCSTLTTGAGSARELEDAGTGADEGAGCIVTRGTSVQ